jgi:PAS domain S-box-containing protein
MIQVLYVDDEPMLLEIGKMFLESAGEFGVDTALSADLALTALASVRYDAVISDYQMPGMDGIAFLKLIRTQQADLPFILFTGRGREEVVIDALNNGADFYLQKGGEPRAQFAELAHKVRQAVQSRRAGMELKAAYEQLTATEEMLRKNLQEIVEAKRAIQESEEKYHALVDHALESIMILDMQGMILFANHAAARLVEAETPRMLTGKNVMEFITPESRAQVIEDLRQVAAGHDAYLAEYSALTLTRKKLFVECIGKAIAYDGKPADLISLRDITDRKETRRALLENQRMLTTLIDNLPGFVYRCANDREWTMAYISDGCRQVTGYSPEDLLGNRTLAYNDIIRPDFQDTVFTRWQEVLAKKGVFEAEYPVITREGEERTVWERGRGIFSEDGKLLFLEGFITDITSRKKAEEAQQASEEKYRLLIENAEEAIAVVQDFHIVFFNPRLLQMGGYTAEELAVRSITELSHPDDQEKIRKNHLLQSGGTPITGPYIVRFLTKTGTVRWIEIKSAPITWDGSSASLNFYTDITEKRQADEALSQANRHLSLLSGIIRHDIRNQLMALKAYLQISKTTLGDEKLTSVYIARQEQVADSIERQILFSKEYEALGAGASKWQNIAGCIQGRMKDLDLTGIAVTLDALDGIEVYADPLLEKVFYNIFDNSMRHGGDAITMIRFSSSLDGTGLLLICEDNGLGVAVDDKEMIFERGFGKNTGFGLFLVREILAISGLTIRETGAPGKGARFEIFVPEGAWRTRPDPDPPGTPL